MRISPLAATSSRDRLTIADLSLCGYLFLADEIGVDWDDYPHLRDWLARMRDEPGWVHPYALMPGIRGRRPPCHDPGRTRSAKTRPGGHCGPTG